MAKDAGQGDSTVAPLTAGDVTRQAELVVMEYLKSTRCAKTLDAIMSRGPSQSSVSPLSSDLYAEDLEKAKKTGAKSVLDYVVTTMANEAPTSSTPLDKKSLTSSHSSRRRGSMDDSGDERSPVEWTKDEVHLLKKAIKQTSDVEDKNDRWKKIASLVGNGKTKKHCYLKYKQLKEEKSSSRSSSSERPSSRRSSMENKARDREDSVSSSTETSTTKTTGNVEPQKQPEASSIKITAKEEPKKQPTATAKEVEQGFVMTRVSPTTTKQSSSTQAEHLQVEDCEDFDTAPTAPSSRGREGKTQDRPATSSSAVTPGRPPTADETEALRDILFPADRKGFSSHWEEQGFFFCETRDLRFGLIQHQGGPCGVLAVVQAFVLRFLLESMRPSDWRNPTRKEQEQALGEALTHIIWQAARASRRSDCLIVLNDDKVSSSATKRKFMTGVQVFSARSVEQTNAFILQHLEQFTAPKGNGLVLLVLSMLLSKRVETIKPEMDSVEGALGGGGKLIGGHDYCTQEIVNLLLCGVASSNVFNGKQLLEGASEDDPKAVVLKGIPARCDVGFLSLFEAYEYIVVGSYLKVPRFNVWVVCSESHYSVMFADPALLTSDAIHDKLTKLDIFCFDGLGNQDEEIRLTVHAFAHTERAKPNPHDLVPPLNLVLQTKWPLARIDWNGVEPLL